MYHLPPKKAKELERRRKIMLEMLMTDATIKDMAGAMGGSPALAGKQLAQMGYRKMLVLPAERAAILERRRRLVSFEQ